MMGLLQQIINTDDVVFSNLYYLLQFIINLNYADFFSACDTNCVSCDSAGENKCDGECVDGWGFDSSEFICRGIVCFPFASGRVVDLMTTLI